MLDRDFENESKRAIPDVLAKCEADGCDWETTGDLLIREPYGFVLESALTQKCRQHHILLGTHHNRFVFSIAGGKEIGSAAISSKCYPSGQAEFPNHDK